MKSACGWFGAAISVLVVCVLLTPAAKAYGGSGHELFCQMAYELSQPATQRKLDAMADAHPDYENFASICNWADHIKSDDRWGYASPHHYVNFARTADKVTELDCPSQGCILSAIMHHYNVLQYNQDSWTSLAFLAHFIGDLHQPLHVSYADDRGGNRAQLDFYGEPSNLHWVWDSGMLNKRGVEPMKQKVSALLNGVSPLAQAVALKRETVLEWANESAAITRGVYTDFSKYQQVDDSYTALYGPVLEQRLQQGAQRLAAVLDHIYGEKN
ncbi:S1/P1 nuclease [Pseudidiomarina sp.]|uniref:S1/P1 nuclease n=1 Tax=Pseudidiomarina sp. TaxID=2081707 RepID=UPI00299D8763|nr:S1/P1 nuclease [Pseudidiomarina sp.]MDX1705782.1 S1/P1 nuclease [Pseudidiomarina sp.]